MVIKGNVGFAALHCVECFGQHGAHDTDVCIVGIGHRVGQVANNARKVFSRGGFAFVLIPVGSFLHVATERLEVGHTQGRCRRYPLLSLLIRQL